MRSKKELLVSVLADSMIDLLNKKYHIDYFSALQVVLVSKTYEDLFRYEWFRQEGTAYIQSCFEQEIESSPELNKMLITENKEAIS